MLKRLGLLLGMIRFSHTVFALPFALSSAALAWKSKNHFAWLDLVGIVLCMVFARSTAMAVNRLADRFLDAANPRTAGRHLPAGQLSVATVALFTVICAAGFVASTLLFLPNYWPILLAVPVLAFVCAYSYSKRFTSFAHFWLGASLLLAPVGAWIAIRGFAGIEIALVLGLGVLFWVAGFDIFYACQDVDFDRRVGLFSVPARFGVAAGLKVALACHLIMLASLVLLWWIAGDLLGWVYLAGTAAVAVLLIYEHWLVRPDDLSRVNQAFFQVNSVISIGLFLIVLVQVLV
jgi:4-hydroxybenzoate polyprenyltransferase